MCAETSWKPRFAGAELEGVAEACQEAGVWVLSDEVYGHATFGGARHESIATLPGMRERTLVLGSASKLLWLTGWRVGWVFGPKEAIAAATAMHGYMTFCAPVPLQASAAAR